MLAAESPFAMTICFSGETTELDRVQLTSFRLLLFFRSISVSPRHSDAAVAGVQKALDPLKRF